MTRICRTFRSALAAALPLLLHRSAPPAVACPECDAAVAGMADDSKSHGASDVAPTSDPADSTALSINPSYGPASDSKSTGKRFSFNAGVYVPSAYYYRGYLQQDKGLIVQPFATLGYTLYQDEQWRVRPYLASWNSFHTASSQGVYGAHGSHRATRVEQRTETYIDPGHSGNEEPHEHTRVVQAIVDAGASGDGKGWYETQITAGLVTDFGDWTLDLKYHAHLFPDDSHDAVQELGGKLSYDLAGLWEADTAARSFTLKPSVAVFWELDDDNGPEEAYIETTLEPAYKFRAFGQRAALAAPFSVGMSPDGYFSDANGADAAVGFVSASLKGSIELPVPNKFGTWFLNGQLTYLRMIADSAEDANRGRSDEVIGTVGISVSF